MLGFIIAIVIGGVAGYIAERIMKVDHPIWLNIVLGMAGAFLFNIVSWLLLGIAGGNIVWQLVAGVIGACALIWGYREYEKRRS
ncbi:MAG: GlsB/YeaQ/YmgE family stress response membrane protein [Alphaproteobacteria bacterium]|nr:GlsB/YeaQ/YmgE family stress response membrane protein [Alphaproteobacteria bacterium]